MRTNNKLNALSFISQKIFGVLSSVIVTFNKKYIIFSMPEQTDPFEEMLQRWRAVGNTVSNLTGPRYEPQTSRSRDERVTA